jgi:uncharacterized protein DUF4082
VTSYWGNYAGSFSTTGLGGSPQQNGVAFQVDTSTDINSLRWYRGATGSGWACNGIRLWRVSDGAKLAEVLSPTDDGTVGWQATGIAPVTLVTGQTYIVASYHPPSTSVAYIASDGPSSVPSPFVKISNTGRYNTSTSYPDSVTGSFAWAADASTDTASGGGGSGGGITVVQDDANLAGWLSSSSSVNTHQTDGLPWLTKAVVDAIKTTVDASLNLAGGLQALSDSLAHTIQMASDWFASGSSTIFTDLKDRVLGSSGGGGSAFYGPDGTQVSAGVEALLARSTNAQVGFPASPWEMTAETDFDGCIAWAQPADLYTVSFTTTPPTIPDNGQCGVPVRYRLAWWTPLNGEFAQERHWIDFEKIHLVDSAGRMPGVLLQTYVGGTGHLEAWTLNV